MKVQDILSSQVFIGGVRNVEISKRYILTCFCNIHSRHSEPQSGPVPRKCKFPRNQTLIAHELSWSFVKLTFHYCKSFAYELHLQSCCLSEEILL